MKPAPIDKLAELARKAQLVREHCDALVNDDAESYQRTATQLRAILRAEGLPEPRQYPKGIRASLRKAAR